MNIFRAFFGRGRVLLAACLIVAVNADAQSDEAKAVATRYAREKAVVYEQSEHLRFAWENGKLTARSTIVQEVMPLSDAAAFNSGVVYHSYFHTLEDLEARTLVPDGKSGYKTVKATDQKTTHATSDAVFYDDSKQTTVTFPGLVPGARTRLQHDLVHNDLHLLTPAHFASYLPIVKARYTITAPRDVKLRFTVRGNEKGIIRRREESGKGGTTNYVFEATDVPRLESFPSAPSPAYYMPQVIVQVEGFTAPGASEPTPFLSNTADLYRYYYGFIRDINNKPDDSVRVLAHALIQGATTDRDKAARIYPWVQEHVRYVAFEDGTGGFIPREAGAVCARRYGDCKDMSSLLVSLCQAAGLDAHYTWIGTRALPYSYAEVPLPLADNHMICAVRLDGQWTFLDGTDPDLPFGLPPAALQGKEALIGVDSTRYEVMKVPETNASENTVVDSTRLAIGADGNLTGDVYIVYTGYPAWDLTGLVRFSDPTEREKTFRGLSARGSNKYAQRSFDYKAAGLREPFRIQSSFELKDYARALDKELFVNLNLQRTYESDAVDPAKRNVPIQQNYKQQLRQVTVLDIPAGYKVSHLPPPATDAEPGLWSYRIRYEQTAKSVKLIKEYEMATLMIEPAQFAAHNRMTEALRKAYKESVVLEKQ